MEVCIHPTDQGGIAISPNNGTFQLDMSQPITSCMLVVYNIQGKKKCGVFQINVITKDFFTCESMTTLAQSMQAISYLEFMADYSAYLAGNSSEADSQQINS